MHHAALAILLLVAASCATPLSELPYCAAELQYATTPLTACRETDAVRVYEDRLAWEILRRFQWSFPPNVPLRVRVTPTGRVGEVCTGTASAPPTWSTRDRVAASLRDLRRAPEAPACLAGTTLDLGAALASLSTGTHLDQPYGMVHRCVEFVPPGRRLPGWQHCRNHPDAVCAVYRDGSRQDFDNLCLACAAQGVEGFQRGRCGNAAQ